MKVVIDVKAINVGRYKNGDSEKIWRRVNRPIKETEKIDYYRCYVSIFN